MHQNLAHQKTSTELAPGHAPIPLWEILHVTPEKRASAGEKESCRVSLEAPVNEEWNAESVLPHLFQEWYTAPSHGISWYCIK